MNNTMVKNIIAFFIWIVCLSGLVAFAQPYPGGVASPCVWFQTSPVNSDRNGDYHWGDLSANPTYLYRKGTGTEATASRSDIHTYNFNPAMPFDSTVSHEFRVKGASLNQRTVIGVVGAKAQNASNDAFLYHVKAKSDQGRVLSKTKVVRTSADTKSSYDYSPNLVMKRDSAERVKILSYLEAQKSDHSIWNIGNSVQINIGGKFEQAWAMGDSAFSSELDSISASTFYMPEMAVYSRFLRPGERQRVESYLALKYGITLPTLYISPSGKILWNDKKYKNRIVGYGRDDRSSFYQEQSTTSYEENAYDMDDTYHRGNSNLESSAYNLIVMGFMEGTDLPDSSYVLFADNGQPTIVDTIRNRKDSIDYTDSMKVMKRVWRVRNWGVDSTYIHRLELGYEMLEDTAFALYRDSSAYLLIDRSGKDDFKSMVDTIRMTSLDEERQKIIFEGVLLDSLCHFTFGYSGIPRREKEPVKYEYFLEMGDPTCNGYENNSDGYLKLMLPHNESGYYYGFKATNLGGANLMTANDSIEITNISADNYYLTILPVDSRTIDFDGTGTTLANVNFRNNGGVIVWPLSETSQESKVAFVNILENNADEAVLRYGVKVANGNLYVIDNYQIESDSVSVANEGDVIRIERTSPTAITIYRNDVQIRTLTIADGSTFKFGVKATNGNVKNISLENFNWGRGDFPDFFFDTYQFLGVFSFSNTDISAYPTGYMNYFIDFDVKCWENTSNDSENSIQVLTDQSNRTFTATLALGQATDVTFLVYSLNNILLFEYNTYAYSGAASKTFAVKQPGEYIVVAITGDGRMFEGRTILR